MPKGRTIDFRTFWDAYGKKRDRGDAEKVWQRLSAKDRRAAIDGIAAYREACLRDGVAMMYGQGYLSHRRWERQASDRQKGGLPELEAFEDMEIW